MLVGRCSVWKVLGMPSNLHRVLVANRGEIAIRIMRAASNLGIETVVVYTTDDAAAPHVGRADQRVALDGTGVAGYLDVDAIVEAARTARADAVHPGYGFLAENADLARACSDAGLVFVGPDADVLELFGDKVAARRAAAAAGLNVLPGSDGPSRATRDGASAREPISRSATNLVDMEDTSSINGKRADYFKGKAS